MPKDLRRALERAEASKLALAERKAASRALTWRGRWSASVPYLTGDAVEHEGSSYRAIRDNRGKEPPPPDAAPSKDWDLLAAKGEKGDRGEQGQRGISGMGMAGPQGPAGPPGPGGGTPTFLSIAKWRSVG